MLYFHTCMREKRKERAAIMLREALALVPKWVYFLLLLVFFELLADILAKQFALSGKYSFAVLSIMGFIAANTAWLISLRTGAELGKGAVLFSVLSAIGAVIVAIFFYHEKATPYQYLGLLLG